MQVKLHDYWVCVGRFNLFHVYYFVYPPPPFISIQYNSLHKIRAYSLLKKAVICRDKMLTAKWLKADDAVFDLFNVY